MLSPPVPPLVEGTSVGRRPLRVMNTPSARCFAALLPLLLACSATSERTLDSTVSTGAGASGPTSGSSSDGPSSGSLGVGGADLTGSGAGATSTGSSGSECTEAATYVYVLSTSNELWSFQPDKKLFKKVGPLGCNTALQPNSMAVDRDATAWINYVGSDGLSDNQGALYPVSTQDASCKGGPMPLPFGWYRIGMGFSSNGNGGDAETLYVAGTSNGIGLGSFDFGAKMLKPIGTFSGALSGQSAELTGTGDGRLFGFFTTFPVQVAEINKDSSAILSAKQLPEVPTPSAWAFSFWGGDFYLYTSDGFTNSRVSRYRPSDGTVITNYVADVGFIIVGAGVSTCAPVEPPK